eukprot:TRINITY_DN6066_c0_g1_i1.p1 TRINITY_DN6066_c0_g1~~TRINITY_DN6066_c0_g1_i1.p1  ORF type:complete len:551 (-),score=36.04 TRINITY_DN6066_c0_g1_i1:312-1964(-)
MTLFKCTPEIFIQDKILNQTLQYAGVFWRRYGTNYDPWKSEIKEIGVTEYINYALQVEKLQNERCRVPCIEDGLTLSERALLVELYQLRKQGMDIPNKMFAAELVCGGANWKYGTNTNGLHYVFNRMADKYKNHITLIEATGGKKEVGGNLPNIQHQRMRLTENADLIFDFEASFKESLTPKVLHCRMPFVLCSPRFILQHGLQIISPAHNIVDVLNVTIEMLKYEQLCHNELTKIIRGPQFCNGGYIPHNKHLKDFYKYGKGNLEQFADFEIIEPGASQSFSQIRISGIPYLSFHEALSGRINTLCKKQVVSGILNIQQESDREVGQAVRLAISPYSNHSIVNQLLSMYENSSMHTTRQMQLYAREVNEKQGRAWPLELLLQYWIENRKLQIQNKEGQISKEAIRQKIIDELQEIRVKLFSLENRKFIRNIGDVFYCSLPQEERNQFFKRCVAQLKQQYANKRNGASYLEITSQSQQILFQSFLEFAIQDQSSSLEQCNEILRLQLPDMMSKWIHQQYTILEWMNLPQNQLLLGQCRNLKIPKSQFLSQ